ncbi:adenylate/guanylate cyclase domain-containing protein [Noviherbaspirillum sp. CPCC 100848]|uniref:Adenylate/guanylate cyclase domain-containing protein n=1 Tax=Noviherbaspirillum album TaxID=3080276 RepID=A0ABU6J501_9BURK|nr:adenylate/guanylate cyclase domain-containing protein [Noviherbaspirillum sp. CPCC 100848]MEC4718703.1 adenylate/guanylate cyclase domain-containing protein [Noviherbaspirillum sp. CPCC 100848]
MLKQLNRTFIGSVLFIDIVGYSTRTVPDQLEMKEVFNAMLADAVQNVAPNERIMVDTGDGAGIAFLGDPEDALFAALSLRDAIETMGVGIGEPGFVRMGINLGPLKIVRDINGHTNMIGDGVNDAQRVMSFSEPGQVMVSHSYYDIISRFSRDYTQLFVYEGMRQDKHVREHEVYRFGPLKDNENLTEKLRDRSRARHTVSHEPVPETIPMSAAASGRQTAAQSAAGHGQGQAQGQAPAAGRMSRTGLIAAGVGALSLVGAVWSWTSAPKEPQESTTAMTAPAQAAPASPDTASPPSSAAAAGVKADMAAAAKPQAVPAAAAAVAAPAPTPPVAAAAPAGGSANAEPAAPPVKPGTINLAIQPWGEIYVDGTKRGISPPIKSISLAPGKHRIEVRNGDFAPYKETIEVKAGGESTVQFVF